MHVPGQHACVTHKTYKRDFPFLAKLCHVKELISATELSPTHQEVNRQWKDVLVNLSLLKIILLTVASFLPMSLHPFPCSQHYVVLERFHLSHEWHKSLNIATRISTCKFIFISKKNHVWGSNEIVQDLWHEPHNEITSNLVSLTFLTGYSPSTCQELLHAIVTKPLCSFVF